MKKTLENEENLTLIQGMVEELIVEDGECKGVITQDRSNLSSKNSYYYNRNIFTRGNYYWGIKIFKWSE